MAFLIFTYCRAWILLHVPSVFAVRVLCEQHRRGGGRADFRNQSIRNRAKKPVNTKHLCPLSPLRAFRSIFIIAHLSVNYNENYEDYMDNLNLIYEI